MFATSGTPQAAGLGELVHTFALAMGACVWQNADALLSTRNPVRYHLTDEGLSRNELGYDETPVAGEYGNAVTCFE